MPQISGESHLWFSVPSNNSGYGNELRVGRGVSLYYDLQPPNVWNEHAHPTAQIVLALDPVDAHMSWRANGRHSRYKCGVPHAWFVPSDIPHSAEWCQRTAAMAVFFLEREFVRAECGREPEDGALFRLGPLVQHDYLLNRFCESFRDLCHRRTFVSEPMMFAGAAVLSSVILRACVRRVSVGGGFARGLSDKNLNLVASYIEKHLGEPMTPALLARLVNLSSDHFGRVFRVSTGLTPMKYVWQCRLRRARLLIEAGEKVAAVAAELGFCDQSHLDRKFRAAFGCSPGSVSPFRNRP